VHQADHPSPTKQAQLPPETRMPILNNLITADIQGEQYYNAYLEKVAKHQRYLTGEEVSDLDSPAPKPDKATKPKATKQSNPLATKAAPVTKPAAAKAPKTIASRPPKPTPTTTEPSKKDQSKKHKLVKESSEAPSPAKRPKASKVIKKRTQKSSLQLVDEFVDEGFPVNEPRFGDEEADLQKGKGKEKVGKEQAAQVLLNIQTPKKKRHELGLTDSETESDEEAGSNPGDATVSQPQPSHVVHAGPNLEHIDVKEFSFTNQFLEEKSQEDEPEKPNTKLEVQSMVTVPIHQDTSSVPLMTTLVIDLIVSQPVSTTRIGELEQHMEDLLQENLALEERLDKHGSRLYKLENLDIPHQVSKAVDEIVMDVVDWAIQAPLRDRFRDLPKADIKEILHHRIWETKSYEAHEDHKNLYEALEKSMDRDHSDQLLTDLAEVQRKKKRRHESPKTPPRSPPYHPPPPLPPAGPSRTLVAFGASGSS
ncbi:hypothetical protein Tco_1389441, partial [Tanacetum coccineum]